MRGAKEMQVPSGSSSCFFLEHPLRWFALQVVRFRPHRIRCVGVHRMSYESVNIVCPVARDLFEAATSEPVTLSRVPFIFQPGSAPAKEIVVSVRPTMVRRLSLKPMTAFF
jgi:hypothetical protein